MVTWVRSLVAEGARRSVGDAAHATDAGGSGAAVGNERGGEDFELGEGRRRDRGGRRNGYVRCGRVVGAYN